MSHSEALLDLLDRIWCGAVLVDSQRSVAGFNAVAQTHLQELCEQYAEAIHNGWARDLLRQLEQNTACCRGLPLPTPPTPRHGDRPLVAYVWSFPWSDDGDPKPLLILIDLDRPGEAGEALLRQLFGLTGAEARLAARMADGRGLEEIASELRITTGTARAQLRSVFAKTHTHRQGELVALLNRAGLLRVDGEVSEVSDLAALP